MNDERQGGFAEIANPYIVGNPVREPTMFFGREAEFEFARKRFVGGERGGLLVFCGERRSGKTSILFQILEGRLGGDFIPILIDMQSMAIRDESDFLTRVAAEIAAAMRARGTAVSVPDFTTGGKPSAVFLEFVRQVRAAAPNKTPVLMFDEYELFENKIDAGALTEDMLNIFAHLMEQHDVYFVFTGSQHLEKRQRPYWRLLGRSLHRAISYLQHEDALRLIREPVAGRVRYAEGTEETIYRLTAGQPFYTQAICQRLVDHLNEAQTSVATPGILESVVRDVVSNALPQMVFLWESLERDEKIVLALLAEQLADADDRATVEQITALRASRKYPVDLDVARMATALENLFAKELLGKSHDLPPHYSFRMDIWRRWIRVMHSVWQVTRELGIKRAPVRRLTTPGRVALAVLLVGVVAVIGWFDLARRTDRQRIPPVPPPAILAEHGEVTIRIPEQARLYLNGRATGGVGESWIGSLPVGVDQQVRVVAEGYADSSFVVRPVEGRAIDIALSLRPVFGELAITTTPAGADVFVDGEPRGQSPGAGNRLLLRLPAAKTYTVRAALAGRDAVEKSVRVLADSTLGLHLALAEALVEVTVLSHPEGASIDIEGRPAERTTLAQPLVRSLAAGAHRIHASLEGHVAVDSTVQVTGKTQRVVFSLREEPLGELVIVGDVYARQIRVDGQRVATDVQHYKLPSLRPGVHQLYVQMQDGTNLEVEVEVISGHRLVFDYTRKEVTRREPLGGS
ncbi:MAG TPA: PEGA domain-containing protein [Candidatus Krumholzibacteria bacterium]|nr:PEGA domain-containing protein [Candidatus Krumholzibacteria bacterium]